MGEGIPRVCLHCVSNGMAVIQDPALSGLTFIPGNHLGLDAAACGNERYHDIHFQAQDSVTDSFQDDVKNFSISNNAVLNNLSKSAKVLLSLAGV